MSLFTPRFIQLRTKTENRLELFGKPNTDFFVLTGLSAALASLGLLLNNTAVVIGAMLVAPLITPIFGFGLSLIVFRVHRMYTALLSLLLGTIIIFTISALIGYIVMWINGGTLSLTSEILSRAEPNLLFFLVAFFSGMVGAYTYVRSNILSSIAGVAISVALIPPASVFGLALVMHNWFILEQSLFLYVLNLAGVFFGGIVMFLFFGFGKNIVQK